MLSRREIFNSNSYQANNDSTNASLWLNKFIREQKREKEESTAKQDLVNQVSQLRVPDIYKQFYEDIWLPSLDKITKKYIKIAGRMIVGLGAESVLETSITLHRTYGVPYIPGSALKGLAANYAYKYLGENWKKEPKDNDGKMVIGEAHKLMFGSQNSAGFVIFHDALYVPNSRIKDGRDLPLEPDILTVHHQNYYNDGKVAPADWDNPVPIPLLSAQGCYLLALSANSGDSDFDEKMTCLAVQIIERALRDEGIGAKTSSGYGRATLIDLPRSAAEKLIEREQKFAAGKNQLLENVENKLAVISGYEKENRKVFSKIVTADLARLEGEMKKHAAQLIVDRARQLSQQADSVLESAEWFVAAKKMLQ